MLRDDAVPICCLRCFERRRSGYDRVTEVMMEGDSGWSDL